MLPPGGEAGRDLFTRTAAGSEPPAAAGRRGSEPSAAAGRGIPGREPNRAARPKTSVRRLACDREPLSSRRAERSTLSAVAPPSSAQRFRPPAPVQRSALPPSRPRSAQRFRPPAPVQRSARVSSRDTRAGSTGAGPAGGRSAQRSTGAGGRKAPRRRSDPPAVRDRRFRSRERGLPSPLDGEGRVENAGGGARCSGLRRPPPSQRREPHTAAAIGRRDRGTARTRARADGTSVGRAGKTGALNQAPPPSPCGSHWHEAARANREIVPIKRHAGAANRRHALCLESCLGAIHDQVPCTTSAPMLITRI